VGVAELFKHTRGDCLPQHLRWDSHGGAVVALRQRRGGGQDNAVPLPPSGGWRRNGGSLVVYTFWMLPRCNRAHARTTDLYGAFLPCLRWFAL